MPPNWHSILITRVMNAIFYLGFDVKPINACEVLDRTELDRHRACSGDS